MKSQSWSPPPYPTEVVHIAIPCELWDTSKVTIQLDSITVSHWGVVQRVFLFLYNDKNKNSAALRTSGEILVSVRHFLSTVADNSQIKAVEQFAGTSNLSQYTEVAASIHIGHIRATNCSTQGGQIRSVLGNTTDCCCNRTTSIELQVTRQTLQEPTRRNIQLETEVALSGKVYCKRSAIRDQKVATGSWRWTSWFVLLVPSTCSPSCCVSPGSFEVARALSNLRVR